MHRRTPICVLVGAYLWGSPTDAAAPGPQVLQIEHSRALALAQAAPALEAARARAAEAERAIDAAKVWPHNPWLRGRVGPRFGPTNTTVDGFVSLEQRLELGGQRGARVDAARAGADAGQARLADARRRLLRDVSLSFAAALSSAERVEIAQANLRLAEAIARVAQRRHEVGDIGGLEASVATLAVVRAQAEADRAAVSKIRASGRVAALLGLEPSLQVQCEGDLGTLVPVSQVPAELAARADLRALHADAEQAEAAERLGDARRIPDISVGAQYVREGQDDVLRGTLGLTLPIFDRGQGEAAVARARKARSEAEFVAASRAAAREARTLRDAAVRLTQAELRYKAAGLEPLASAERSATQSYEAGAIPLGEVLTVRRELMLARAAYAELRFEAARARIELAASAGDLQ